MKRLIAWILVAVMICSFSACGKHAETPAADPMQTPDAEEKPTEETPVRQQEETSASQPVVYYMNPNVEEDEIWQSLAAAYSIRTGIPVRVVTTPAGTYDEKLDAALGSDDMPTLFQVSGTAELLQRRDWCLDLSGAAVYQELASEQYALKDGEAVLALACEANFYGLIVNRTLLSAAGVSLDEIESMATLQTAAAAITANGEALNACAFTIPGGDPAIRELLINLPLSYEFRNAGALTMDTISGAFLANWKAQWDLFCANTDGGAAALLSKTVEESTEEFLEGKAVFFLGSADDYDSLIGEEKFSPNQLAMLPIFAGLGDSTQGLSHAVSQYWCVNAKADEASVKATLEFLHWCVSDGDALNTLAGTQNNRMPYRMALELHTGQAIRQEQRLSEQGRTMIPWHMDTVPSEEWVQQVDAAMTEYLLGNADWTAAADLFVRLWNGEPVEEGA